MANMAVTNSTAIGIGNTQQAISTTYKSLIVIGNSSATTSTYFNTGGYRRGKVYDILVGTNSAPADNYLEFDLAAITWATTASGVTGTLISANSSSLTLDPADVAIIAAIQINSTAEVGITTPVERWYVGVNQRASYRWVAAPGSEMLYPANSSATGNNGVSLRTRSGAFTGNATATVLFNEQ